MTRKGRVGPGCFVCLDKPAGPTSFDLVRDVRRVTGYRRAGHGGTLDPFATGLLVVAVGSATRLLRLFSDAGKRYRATLRFGTVTDTDDSTGAVLHQAPVEFSPVDLSAALQGMLGDIEQRPPRVSAVKVAGERAYALHRSGVPFAELSPRRVHIERIEVVGVHLPEVEVVIDCGGGTYVRSLARDVGEQLGCGAHVSALRRERVGDLEVAQSARPEAFAQEWPVHGMHAPGVLPAARALSKLAHVELATEEVARVRCGQLPAAAAERAVAAAPTVADEDEDIDREVNVALLDPAGELVAVAVSRGGWAHLLVVLPEQEHGDVSGTL